MQCFLNKCTLSHTQIRLGKTQPGGRESNCQIEEHQRTSGTKCPLETKTGEGRRGRERGEGRGGGGGEEGEDKGREMRGNEGREEEREKREEGRRRGERASKGPPSATYFSFLSKSLAAKTGAFCNVSSPADGFCE